MDKRNVYLEQSQVIRSLRFRKSARQSLLNELQDNTENVLGTFPSLDLRLKDVSYTVVNYFDSEDEKTSANETSRNNKQGYSSHASSRVLERQISTVINRSTTFLVLRYLFRCIAYCGCPPRIKEEKQILKNVNLRFESGKAYLVL